jgi:hypothetical protein
MVPFRIRDTNYSILDNLVRDIYIFACLLICTAIYCALTPDDSFVP